MDAFVFLRESNVETVLSTGVPKYAPVLRILGWRTVYRATREPLLPYTAGWCTSALANGNEKKNVAP